MKIRDKVMVLDGGNVGRVIATVVFPTGVKYKVKMENGNTRHKRPSELKVIESAPKLELNNNRQMELKL